MSLIRNGGFERGTTDFWSVELGGTLDIDSVNQKYGTYCGKFTSSGGGADIINNDYIEVSPYDLISLLVWVKNADARKLQPIIYCYDSDYSFIKIVVGYSRIMDGTYMELNTQIPVMQGVSFIRAGLRVDVCATNELFYIDGYSCSIINRDNCISGYTLLLEPGVRYASGDTSEDKKDLQMYNSFEAELNVIFAGGTSPTIDVSVYELLGINDNEILVGTFAQVNDRSIERITLTHCTGRQLYIKYTMGGTNPEFEFGVGLTGKG